MLNIYNLKYCFLRQNLNVSKMINCEFCRENPTWLENSWYVDRRLRYKCIKTCVKFLNDYFSNNCSIIHFAALSHLLEYYKWKIDYNSIINLSLKMSSLLSLLFKSISATRTPFYSFPHFSHFSSISTLYNKSYLVTL